MSPRTAHKLLHAAGSAVMVIAGLIGFIMLASCSAEHPPEPPPAYETVSRTWREGFANNPTTAALIRETATGCLYSVAEGQGAQAVLLPDGRHAGCAGDDGQP